MHKQGQRGLTLQRYKLFLKLPNSLDESFGGLGKIVYFCGQNKKYNESGINK